MMSLFRFVVSLLFLFSLLGCNNDDSHTPPSYSEQGGLPEAQKAQGDNPAGVKFGQDNAFKPLSEPREQP